MKRSSISRHTPMPCPTKPIERAPMRQRNPKRRQSEFARCYHSVERVEWVKALPSVVSGHGPCENVHVLGAGAGRKAGYALIVPMTAEEHRELHRIGVKTFGRRHDIDLVRCAERIANAWTARHPMTAVGDVLAAVLPDLPTAAPKARNA